MQDMQAAFTAALQQNNSIAANAYAKAVAGNTKAGSSGGGGKTHGKIQMLRVSKQPRIS
jgi:hypothetical protein